MSKVGSSITASSLLIKERKLVKIMESSIEYCDLTEKNAMIGSGNQVNLSLKPCFEKFVKSLQVKIMESRIEHCDLTEKTQ